MTSNNGKRCFLWIYISIALPRNACPLPDPENLNLFLSAFLPSQFVLSKVLSTVGSSPRADFSCRQKQWD